MLALIYFGKPLLSSSGTQIAVGVSVDKNGQCMEFNLWLCWRLGKLYFSLEVLLAAVSSFYSFGKYCAQIVHLKFAFKQKIIKSKGTTRTFLFP